MPGAALLGYILTVPLEFGTALILGAARVPPFTAYCTMLSVGCLALVIAASWHRAALLPLELPDVPTEPGGRNPKGS